MTFMMRLRAFRLVSWPEHAGLLSCPHMEIHAELDGLNVLIDVDHAGKRVDGISHQHGALAQLIVIVLKPSRPIFRECPFHAAAAGPAEAVVDAFEAERGTEERSGDAVL